MALRCAAPHDRCLSLLLEQQRDDGSWPPSRCLKGRDPQSETGSEPLFEDGDGLMSTALSLSVLQLALGGRSVQSDNGRRLTTPA